MFFLAQSRRVAQSMAQRNIFKEYFGELRVKNSVRLCAILCVTLRLCARKNMRLCVRIKSWALCEDLHHCGFACCAKEGGDDVTENLKHFSNCFVHSVVCF